MNENRRRILDMLASGKITAEEAERLLGVVENEPAGAPRNGKPKFIRVVVTDEGRHGEPVNVNVRVPMQLLRAGVKLANLIPAAARERVNFALQKEGVPIDLNEIKPENLEEVIEHLSELTVDIDGGRTSKVRVFCE
jgi:hypothetical protein